MSVCTEKSPNPVEVNLLNKELREQNNVHDIDQIAFELSKIGSEILRITLIVKQRNIKDINKNFQATLTNYFLECYVCTLLLKHMGLQYKRDVKKRIESSLKIITPLESCVSSSAPVCTSSPPNIASDGGLNTSQQKETDDRGSLDDEGTTEGEKTQKQNKKVAKYVRLIKAYEDQIKVFKLEEQYINMLIEKINEDVNCFSKDTQKYITQYQKKLCALLILQHFLQGRAGIIFRSFCELWNSVFLNLPLYYFARENNIFYNKVKMGEQNEKEKFSQIMYESDIKENTKEWQKNSKHHNNGSIKQSSASKGSKKYGLNGSTAASYKFIQQSPPNISIDYEQLLLSYYEKVEKDLKTGSNEATNKHHLITRVLKKEEHEVGAMSRLPMHFKVENSLAAEQGKLEDQEIQSKAKNSPKEIHIVNLFVPAEKSKVKKESHLLSLRKKKLESSPDEFPKYSQLQNRFYPEEDKSNDVAAIVYKKRKIEEKDHHQQQEFSQPSLLNDFGDTLQKTESVWLKNESNTTYTHQGPSQENQDKNSKKQAKYRFI